MNNNNTNIQNQMVNSMNINNNIQNQMFSSMNYNNNIMQNQMLHSMNISNNVQNQIHNNMNNNNTNNQNQILNNMNNNNMQNQILNNMNNNNINMQNQMSNIMSNNNMQNQMSNIINSNNMQNQMPNFMNSNIMQNQMSFMSQFYNPNMNMNMNPQVVNNKEKDDDIYKNDPEDIYPYIKEPKKEIILVTSDLKRKRILIPDSLRKNELYYTSTKFRRYKYLSNGDIIKINEYLDVDTSFSETLLLKYKNSERINITCTNSNGVKFIKSLPVDITVFDMMKAFYAAMEIPFKYFEGKFISNGMDLTDKKNEILKDLFKGSSSINITYCSLENLAGGDPFYNLKLEKF